MSMIYDATLKTLWAEAQAKKDKEFASVALWNHLYSKYIFPEKEWVISPEAPPEGEGLRRVDLVTKYTSEAGGLRVLIFHEQKPHDASRDEIDHCEHQAYDACVRYLGAEQVPFVYAVTSYGTKGRAWKLSSDDEIEGDYLQPFWGKRSLSDRDEYRDLYSLGAKDLSDAFGLVKLFAPTKVQGIEYGGS